jgi:hypothetical protein
MHRLILNYGNTFTYTKPKNIKQNTLTIEINPRVSFNYDVNGDQSVILRGGSGILTGRVPFAWFGYAFYNNGATYGAYDANHLQLQLKQVLTRFRLLKRRFRLMLIQQGASIPLLPALPR